MSIHAHIWLRTACIWIIFATKWHCSATFLHKSGAVRSVDWIFIIGAPAWRWLGEYVTLDKTFYNLIFKQEAVAAPVTAKFSSLSHSSRRPLLEIYYNYTMRDNNSIINNNYGSLVDLILLFKIPMGTRNNFFKIYKQIGQAASESFSIPGPYSVNYGSPDFWTEWSTVIKSSVICHSTLHINIRSTMPRK